MRHVIFLGTTSSYYSYQNHLLSIESRFGHRDSSAKTVAPRDYVSSVLSQAGMAKTEILIDRGGVVIERGTVKWFSAPKGYGFILRPNGEEVFVHYSTIEMKGYRKLEEGAEVEFGLKEGPKGRHAVEVVRIQPQSNGTVPGQPPLSPEF